MAGKTMGRTGYLALALLLAGAGASLHAQEMVGKYKLVSALPRPAIDHLTG
jgi:hypothetical protein